jgi:hypothetical protein
MNVHEEKVDDASPPSQSAPPLSVAELPRKKHKVAVSDEAQLPLAPPVIAVLSLKTHEVRVTMA